MKKLSCLLLCMAALAVLLCSCAAKPGEVEESAPTQIITTAAAAATEATVAELPKAQGSGQASESAAPSRPIPTALAPDFIRYYPTTTAGSPKPTLIGSKAELDAFEQEYFDGSVEIAAALSKYSEEYFDEFDLALVGLTESSGSVSHRITGTRVEGGKLVVEIEARSPSVGTCDMAQWLIVTSCGKGLSGVEAQVSRKTAP